MIGYWLTRSTCPGRCFAGTSASEVANAIRYEVECDLGSGLPFDEIDIISVEAVEITQEQIDEMPEFQGW